MFKNYIKIAWRNFSRNKFYSTINVLGLSIGMACLILIMLFVTDELSYDNFHELTFITAGLIALLSAIRP